MALTADDRLLLAAIADASDDLVQRAVGWCAINSGSRNLEGLERQSEPLVTLLERLPGDVERLPLSETAHIEANGDEVRQPNGAALRLTVRPTAPVQIAMTGHYDTVYAPGGDFTEARRRADGALHGPGIADMKGGISVMLGALEAFEGHPLAAELGYQVLLSPDEETGSLASAPLLAALGARAHIGLTYEPALAGGELVSARKGSGNFHLAVRGRAAHAGRDFALGRNAVVAAAALAGELAALNGRREGVTVNVSRIDGGSAPNAVPDRAVIRFNIRYPDVSAGAWAFAAVRSIAEARMDGVTARLHGALHRPAKPFNVAQQALFQAVKSVGAELGLDLAWRPSGGCCEGNNLFAAGLPGVDTLGVRGGDIHSSAEHAWPDSFAERASLSALIFARLAGGQIDAPGLKAALAAETPHKEIA